MVDFETGSDEKLAYFQAITGIDDPALCTEILTAHNWNLELAISTITNNAGPSNEPNPDSWQTLQEPNHSANLDDDRSLQLQNHPNPPGLAWKLLTLPFSVSLGLVTRAIGLGMWVGGGVVSHSLGFLGWGSRRGEDGVSSSAPLVSVSASAIEAMSFVSSFERDYGGSCHPNFVREGFMEALQRSREEFKLLFVYLHSQDHPDTQIFCENTLCSEAVAAFVNENFVAWGGSIRASEGFKMSNSLKASRFPFCAVVMAAANQRIALLQQVEGPESPEQLLSVLQKVIEESAPVLVTARLDEEERRNNRRLREEQDAAYRAALEADQARERQRKEEEERLEREAAEAERKLREEEQAVERAAHEAAEKEAALERRRQEKAMSLGPEPEKGPDVTQVLVRFPTGERKERRFHSSAMIRSLYDFVDSLDCLEAEKYSLVSNFPRVIYNSEKHSLTLREAGLHPQASLFVEVNT